MISFYSLAIPPVLFGIFTVVVLWLRFKGEAERKRRDYWQSTIDNQRLRDLLDFSCRPWREVDNREAYIKKRMRYDDIN